MENNIRYRFGTLACSAIICLFAMAVSSCTTLQRWSFPKRAASERNVTARIVSQDKEPVWIKPVLGSAWVAPHTNAKGDFIGGHYVATIVEQGRWTTEEEAELLGRDFLRTQDSLPILPEPVPDPLPPSLHALPQASIASLRNQIPIGSASPSSETIPSADYYPQSNRIVITDLPDPNGSYSIDTPKGLVLLRRQGDDILVEFDGRTLRTPMGKKRPIEITLEAS